MYLHQVQQIVAEPRQFDIVGRVAQIWPVHRVSALPNKAVRMQAVFIKPRCFVQILGSTSKPATDKHGSTRINTDGSCTGIRVDPCSSVADFLSAPIVECNQSSRISRRVFFALRSACVSRLEFPASMEPVTAVLTVGCKDGSTADFTELARGHGSERVALRTD